jgi:hypothetical protein
MALTLHYAWVRIAQVDTLAHCVLANVVLGVGISIVAHGVIILYWIRALTSCVVARANIVTLVLGGTRDCQAQVLAGTRAFSIAFVLDCELIPVIAHLTRRFRRIRAQPSCLFALANIMACVASRTSDICTLSFALAHVRVAHVIVRGIEAVIARSIIGLRWVRA